MSTNQIGALTTLIIFGVVYIGTPLWAERRGRNWKIWLFLAFVFPGISLVALFLLPNRKGKHSVTDTLNRGTEKPVMSKTDKFATIYDSLEQPLPDLNTVNTEGKDKVASGPATKKSYTEEFKKEVVHTALTAGTSLSEIARMYEINLTLVRNWKAKYEAEILQEINGDDGNESGDEDDIPTPTAIWHIDRAKFVFSDPAEYKQWKKEKKVFFEFSPSGADDGGEAVFADADAATDDFEVTEDRGLVKITLEKDGPLISAWVGVLAETVEDLDQETLTDWSNDQGGWSCSSIYLGDFEASIVEDDGGDWRLVEADKHWDAEEVEGKYMEVIVTQSDDSEHIYWVNLESLPEDEDEYDWSIQAAVEHHNTLGLEQVSEDEASASEPFSRDESEFTFVNMDMVSSGGNTNSNENGTGVSESRVASVCQITFGILEDGEDRPAGFCGIDDFSKSTTVIGFQDEEGEWVGFAIDDGNGKFFIDNCDIGSLDGKSLREALPYNAGDLWNTIMLSSVDLEEIEEEGIKFKLFDRDDNADDDLRPFHVKSALKGSARTPCHLVVHKTLGQFEFSDFSNQLLDVNSFLNGSLETPVSLTLESLGEISDFETDSETLCIVPLSKDRMPVELTDTKSRTATPERNKGPKKKEVPMLKFEVENASHDFHCYIAANEGFVSSIILYSIFSKPTGDIWCGAYYGAIGGGEIDGGYFRIDIENGSSEHLDYDEVDGLAEDDPSQANIFEAIMQSLWTLVDDDDGDLMLSGEGSKHYAPDDDGIWSDAEFDGDSLDEVSGQWKIRLKFES